MYLSLKSLCQPNQASNWLLRDEIQPKQKAASALNIYMLNCQNSVMLKYSSQTKQIIQRVQDTLISQNSSLSLVQQIA